ncbi:MAG: site-specific integrase [Sphingomonadaceae bacterium]|nr:site-specific integrase [Sphingomonadaceae bacterium]
MPKAKLDAAFCLTAQCRPGKARTDYYDTSITGFVLECRSSGVKTYTYRYQDEYGTARQRRIASYGDITFDQAKKRAQRWRAETVMGGDPASEKADKKAVPTYADLAEDHLTFARAHLRRPENVERVIRVHLLPRWGKERADAITTRDVAKWLAEKRKSGLAPATVEKLKVTLGRSFQLAIRAGVKGVKFNPAQAIPREKFNNARDRFLTAEEAARLLKAAEQSLNPQLKNIIGLLLLTGARRGELLYAKWEHIDLERKLWFLPMTKNGTSRYVPLSKPALDIINQLPRFDGCPWLLPNPASKGKTPYTDLKHPFDTARQAAGLPDVSLHTLRHSAASFMVNAGIDIYAVGRILGHKSIVSSQRYSHLANDTLLAAVEAGAAKMNVDWMGTAPA